VSVLAAKEVFEDLNTEEKKAGLKMSQNKGSNPRKGKKTRQVAQRINLGEYTEYSG
jgi:hypothetical protein